MFYETQINFEAAVCGLGFLPLPRPIDVFARSQSEGASVRPAANGECECGGGIPKKRPSPKTLLISTYNALFFVKNIGHILVA